MIRPLGANENVRRVNFGPKAFDAIHETHESLSVALTNLCRLAEGFEPKIFAVDINDAAVTKYLDSVLIDFDSYRKEQEIVISVQTEGLALAEIFKNIPNGYSSSTLHRLLRELTSEESKKSVAALITDALGPMTVLFGSEPDTFVFKEL